MLEKEKGTADGWRIKYNAVILVVNSMSTYLEVCVPIRAGRI